MTTKERADRMRELAGELALLAAEREFIKEAPDGRIEGFVIGGDVQGYVLVCVGREAGLMKAVAEGLLAQAHGRRNLN